MSPKQILEFWPFKNCFFPWETGNELKDQRKADDVMWRQLICSASLPILVIALCFVELSNVFDCEKGITKQRKILKVSWGGVGSCRYLVDYSTFLWTILRHTSQFELAIRRIFLEENSRVSKTKNKFCKIFDEFKFRIHILHIFTN